VVITGRRIYFSRTCGLSRGAI